MPEGILGETQDKDLGRCACLSELNGSVYGVDGLCKFCITNFIERFTVDL